MKILSVTSERNPERKNLSFFIIAAKRDLYFFPVVGDLEITLTAL
jgi:hypothetical protein